MRLPAGAPGARILGLGDYRPRRLVGNDELATMVETSDEWIRQRTGIATRRLAGPGESVPEMAAAAAEKALAAAGLTGAEVDYVVVATCSTTDRMPAAAARVAERIGADAPGAFDLNAACAGFCYALATAADAIRAGSARHAVVIGAERMSDFIDFTDRTTCILFADGAGAAVIGPADAPGIGPVAWGSDGSGADLIAITAADPHLRQQGQSVFRWATTSLAGVGRRACEAAGVAPASLGAIVLHQANLRIVEAIARQLGAPQAVVGRDVVEAGNTSAASIPLALARLAAEGQVSSGDTALLLGFGAGLSYAGQVVTLP